MPRAGRPSPGLTLGVSVGLLLIYVVAMILAIVVGRLVVAIVLIPFAAFNVVRIVRALRNRRTT
jgi:high-affinity Fe2+/Pb2+ permease